MFCYCVYVNVSVCDSCCHMYPDKCKTYWLAYQPKYLNIWHVFWFFFSFILMHFLPIREGLFYCHNNDKHMLFQLGQFLFIFPGQNMEMVKKFPDSIINTKRGFNNYLWMDNLDILLPFHITKYKEHNKDVMISC